MTTNGILLDKYIDFLIEHNFRILVSLDGNCDNNSYRKFPNGNSSYKKLYKNLKQIQERHREYFNRHIHFNTVLHDKNSINDIYEYFLKEFDQIPSISELSIRNINIDHKDEFWKFFNNRPKSLMEIQNKNISEQIFKLLPQNKS